MFMVCDKGWDMSEAVTGQLRNHVQNNSGLYTTEVKECNKHTDTKSR